MKTNRQEEALAAKIKELEHDGYRVKRLDGKLADALAIKDDQLYAVEVQIAKWNEKRRRWEVPRSWRKHAIFDDVIKVVELENPCFPKEKAKITVARKAPKRQNNSKKKAGKKSTIKVFEETKVLLNDFKIGNDTYEEAILRLVRIAKKDIKN